MKPSSMLLAKQLSSPTGISRLSSSHSQKTKKISPLRFAHSPLVAPAPHGFGEQDNVESSSSSSSNALSGMSVVVLAVRVANSLISLLAAEEAAAGADDETAAGDRRFKKLALVSGRVVEVMKIKQTVHTSTNSTARAIFLGLGVSPSFSSPLLLVLTACLLVVAQLV